MKKLFTCAIVCAFLMASFALQAQVNSGVLPKSAAVQLADAAVPQISVTSPDLTKMLSKDASKSKDGGVFKVATVVPLNYNTNNSGIWETTDDGYDVWRLQLHNSDAKGCCVLFDQFLLPEGSQFFCYNTDKSLIYGPYTSKDNESGEGYATGIFTKGDIILEYVSPHHELAITDRPTINISGYTYFYRSEGLPDFRVHGAKGDETGYGQSQSCMVNINCPEGDNWRDEQKGVARMLAYVMEEGSVGAGWCSGTLVNNTAGDGTPYFLTAFHCADGATSLYYKYFEFYFNYECDGCTCVSEPGYFQTTSCEKMAESNIDGGSDFLLLKLKNLTWTQIKTNNLVFNGWNKSTSASPSGVSIHHPAADVKKISTYNTTLQSGTWHQGYSDAGATNAHWLVHWATTYDQGSAHHSVTEGGSSGSPIFNNNGYVVGTLTGGASTCNDQGYYEYYGKFSYHWQSAGTDNNRRLKPWLDPYNLGESSCKPLDPNGSFYILPAALLYEATGGNKNVTVYSDQAWTLSYGTGDHSWFTVSAESGTGNKTLVITCLQNGDSANMRRCNMTITKADGSTLKFVVKQSGGSASSIETIVEQANVNVYPNPAQDQINIQSDSYIIREVEFIDLLGKVVYHYTCDGSNLITLPVNQLNTALYIIKMTTNQNEVIFKKFSKN